MFIPPICLKIGYILSLLLGLCTQGWRLNSYPAKWNEQNERGSLGLTASWNALSALDCPSLEILQSIHSSKFKPWFLRFLFLTTEWGHCPFIIVWSPCLPIVTVWFIIYFVWYYYHRTTVQHTLGCTGGCTQGVGPGAIAQHRQGVSLGCPRSRAQHRLGLLPRCTTWVKGWKSDPGTGWGGGCWLGYGRLARATGALLSAGPPLGPWESLCALSKSRVSVSTLFQVFWL